MNLTDAAAVAVHYESIQSERLHDAADVLDVVARYQGQAAPSEDPDGILWQRLAETDERYEHVSRPLDQRRHIKSFWRQVRSPQPLILRWKRSRTTMAMAFMISSRVRSTTIPAAAFSANAA